MVDKQPNAKAFIEDHSDIQKGSTHYSHAGCAKVIDAYYFTYQDNEYDHQKLEYSKPLQLEMQEDKVSYGVPLMAFVLENPAGKK